MNQDLRQEYDRLVRCAQQYRFGDKVLVRMEPLGSWNPGRVVGHSGFDVRVATSLPYPIPVNNGMRLLPTGTPVYAKLLLEDISLLGREPHWDPFTVEPFMNRDEYVVLGGDRTTLLANSRSMQVGAYIPTNWYYKGDPVWVVADCWRRAKVIEGSKDVGGNWIRVNYEQGRDSKGYQERSFQAPNIWPVICDFPDAVRRIVVDKD